MWHSLPVNLFRKEKNVGRIIIIKARIREGMLSWDDKSTYNDYESDVRRHKFWSLGGS